MIIVCFILIFTKKIDDNFEIIIMTSEKTKSRRVKEELESVLINDFNLQKINPYTLKEASGDICIDPKIEHFYSPKLTTTNYLTDGNCFNSELLFPKVIVLLNFQFH